jgi:hypothetical protein
MARFRKAALVAVFVAGGLAFAGCSSQLSNLDAKGIIRALPAQNLPPVVVDIDEDGKITRVGGFDLQTLEGLASNFGVDLPTKSLAPISPEYMQWFNDSNIQNLTLAARDDGLFVAVNGELLPAIWWSDESVDNLVEFLGKFERDGNGAYLLDANTQRGLEQLAPLLTTVGLRVDVRLPVPEGQDPIPLVSDDAFKDAFMNEEATNPVQTLALKVDYQNLPNDMGWVPAVSGLSTVDVNNVLAALNQGAINRLRLRRDLEKRLKTEDISGLGVQLRSDGLFAAVDYGAGDAEVKQLPHIAWSEETLANVSGLLARLYPDQIPDNAGWVPVVRAVAPILNDLDLSLQVTFPVDAAAAPQ